jgi:hypothetical protein
MQQPCDDIDATASRVTDEEVDWLACIICLRARLGHACGNGRSTREKMASCQH